MRVKCRIGENIFYDAEGLFSGSLVLFQNDRDLESGSDIFSFSMRHSEVQSLQSKSEDIFLPVMFPPFCEKPAMPFRLSSILTEQAQLQFPRFL